jgi:hypothetical protein
VAPVAQGLHLRLPLVPLSRLDPGERSGLPSSADTSQQPDWNSPTAAYLNQRRLMTKGQEWRSRPD